MNFKTLTGLTLAEVARKLDEELPPDAYTRIPGAVDLTDIDPGYMRQVLNQVFGLCGLGWGYEYHPADLELTFGEKNVLALLKQMTFWYILVGDDGQERRNLIVASGASENRSAAYAMKGALTNAIGNAVSNTGFQESVYLGHRSHATVGRGTGAQKNGANKTSPPAASKTAPPKPANGSAPVPATPAKNGSGGANADVNPGDYIIQIGTQHKGKAVKDLPANALAWFAEKLAATTPAAQEAKAMCAAYLAAHPELRETQPA